MGPRILSIYLHMTISVLRKHRQNYCMIICILLAQAIGLTLRYACLAPFAPWLTLISCEFHNLHQQEHYYLLVYGAKEARGLLSSVSPWRVGLSIGSPPSRWGPAA